MINAILVVIFYLASVSSSSFECSSSLCFFIKLIAAILLIIRLIIKTSIGKKQLDKVKSKLPSKFADAFIGIVSFAAIVVMFLMAFGAKASTAKAGILNFEDKIAEIESLTNEGKTTKALEKIEELKEIYGTNDRMCQEEVLVQIAAGNYGDAKNLLNNLNDKKSIEFYLLSEEVIKGLNADSIENTKTITDFYMNGAKNHPDWAYAQRQAGISQMYRRNYESAEYYLKRAYDLDSSDPLTLYNIGAAIVEQGKNVERFTEAMEYFNCAIECGADDNTKSHIAWYYDKIKGEEE